MPQERKMKKTINHQYFGILSFSDETDTWYGKMDIDENKVDVELQLFLEEEIDLAANYLKREFSKLELVEEAIVDQLYSTYCKEWSQVGRVRVEDFLKELTLTYVSIGNEGKQNFASSFSFETSMFWGHTVVAFLDSGKISVSLFG